MGVLATLFVFRALAKSPWFQALTVVAQALKDSKTELLLTRYAELYAALLNKPANNLLAAAAQDLLWLESGLSKALETDAEIPVGIRAGTIYDLELLLSFLRQDWQAMTSVSLGQSLPPLVGLAKAPDRAEVAALVTVLKQGSAEELLQQLIKRYRQHGAGTLSRFAALRWEAGGFVGIASPAQSEMSRLIGLERPLARLRHNTEALLCGKPAQHSLLYGPRGSGKSTAVRSLLPQYAERGLRLIELQTTALADLSEVIEGLRSRPQFYILFVDDLSFENQERSYGPLKTLLEGSLTARPGNMLIYATSNRRHLVKEQFSDRPDPLNDDVHAWDTQNERLALADRFGLTITFPSASQQRYLEIVRGLALLEGLDIKDLDRLALRHADWGNGYSGRTAQQFIDMLKSDLLS